MRDAHRKSITGYLLGLLATFAFIIVLPQPLHAQDLDYFDLPPEQLLAAKVTSASRRAERLSDVPAAVYVITNEAIRQAGVKSVPDALRMAPGVNVAQADANSWAVSIRGFNGLLANKLLVMIDGRTIYNPLFAGTYWDTRDLMLEDIDRIEVIRGPGGTLWGANAVNGVINIITKNAALTQGNLVTGSAGTPQYGAAATRHGGTIGDDGYFRLYAKATQHGSFRTPDDMDGNDDWNAWRGGFRTDWPGEFTLQGDLYQVRTDQIDSSPILTAPYTLTQEETIETHGANLLGRWTEQMENGGLLTAQTYIDYFRRDQIRLDDERIIYDLDLQYNFPKNENHEVIIGGGYRFMWDSLSGLPIVTFSPDSRNDHLFSAFIHDQITLIPEKWFLTLGSKFEHNDYSGFEFQPNARLMWHPDEDKSVWAAVSHAVRTPSRLEQDLTLTIGVFAPGALLAGLTEVVTAPNRDFDSEELTSYELGYRQQVTSSLSVDIAAFYNEYDNLSALSALPNQTGVNPARTIIPLSFDNIESAETYGAELATNWNITENWSLEASYSLLDMQVHAPTVLNVSQEAEEGQSPNHQLYLGSAWDINRQWSLNSGLYYYSQLQNYDVDDYIRFDVNLEWRARDNLRFNLIGQNLASDGHREFLNETDVNATEINTTVFGKFTWEF